MKIAHVCCRLAGLAALVSFAGCSSVETVAGRHERPEPGKALVVFYREDHILGSPVAYKVRDGNAYPTETIGALPNGSYFTYQATPGQHVFHASTEVMRVFVLNAVAGRTYYIRGGIRPGVVIWRPDFHEVPREVGASAIASLRKVRFSRETKTDMSVVHAY
jgi:hypothetical protein